MLGFVKSGPSHHDYASLCDIATSIAPSFKKGGIKSDKSFKGTKLAINPNFSSYPRKGQMSSDCNSKSRSDSSKAGRGRGRCSKKKGSFPVWQHVTMSTGIGRITLTLPWLLSEPSRCQTAAFLMPKFPGFLSFGARSTHVSSMFTTHVVLHILHTFTCSTDSCVRLQHHPEASTYDGDMSLHAWKELAESLTHANPRERLLPSCLSSFPYAHDQHIVDRKVCSGVWETEWGCWFLYVCLEFHVGDVESGSLASLSQAASLLDACFPPMAGDTLHSESTVAELEFTWRHPLATSPKSLCFP